jgi:hypothetical protein
MSKIHRIKTPNTPNLRQTSLSFVGLRHGVKSATVLEPLDLRGIEGVRELDIEGIASSGWVDSKGHWLSNGNLGCKKINL